MRAYASDVKSVEEGVGDTLALPKGPFMIAAAAAAAAALVLLP
jgi:hypothetical protein